VVADQAPLISVIIPAHDAGKSLGACIDALMASDLPRSQWELIVVDDASADETPDIARRADRVVRISGSPRGPAYARNKGVEAARAPVVAFVDADVCVHSDTLRKLVDRLVASPELAAVFGSYDENPTAPAVHSQYRNLLHHYVHQRSGGETGSFWAGIGAIRTSEFLDAGMFDDVRYRSPQIEDVELGYRLRQRGGRILLDPSIRGTHVKAWTIPGIIRTDLMQRGVPWVRLLLENGPRAVARGPSLGAGDALSVGLVALAVLLAVIWGLTRRLEFAVSVAICVALSVVLSAPFHLWLWKTRGPRVALFSVPLYLLYHVTSVVAIVVGTVVFLFRDAGGRSLGRRSAAT
jgi:cellulose synthase/poly-beta-1,6-N-acetylglucosamine synthase-like glycosyltransferase